jgi:hypothetical protein
MIPNSSHCCTLANGRILGNIPCICIKPYIGNSQATPAAFPMCVSAFPHVSPLHVSHVSPSCKVQEVSSHIRPCEEKKSPRTFNAKKSSRNPDANHTVTHLPRNPHPRNDMPNQTIIPQPRIATPRADRAVQVSAPIDPVRSCLLDKNCPAIGAEHQTSNALVSASLFFLLPPSALRSVPCVSHHDVVWQLAADRCSRSEM